MKAIVFGGSGFLGSHTADALTDAGYEVVIYDQTLSPYLRRKQKMIVGDILSQKDVEKAIKGSDFVYNFAGIADIEEASERPMDSVKFNIIGTTTILEACRKLRVKRFVFASSLYVYGKSGSFYRSTKQSCELLIENYREVYGIPYTILRYGSLYGPRADSRNFIFSLIKQALTRKKIIRGGDGEEIREYIHVHDAAVSGVEILGIEYANQHIIIAGNQQMKVKDLLLMIREMLGNEIEIEYVPKNTRFHYEITPYIFTPKVGKRLMAKTYFDLGQGILKAIQDVYEELHHVPAQNNAGI